MDNIEINTLVVGAGPIGLEVAAGLQAAGERYIQVEAGALGQTITRWPPQTLFFSSPEWIAICGIPIQSNDQRRITGEEYLAYLRQVVESRSLSVNYYERVVRIERNSVPTPRYMAHTSCIGGTRCYLCNNIVLAIGDMANPRALGVEGEDLPAISHWLKDPHHYFQRDLLIVGGRNSAFEAALRCWRAGVRVAISYRRPTLPRRGILARLKLEVELLIAKQQIKLYGATRPHRFGEGYAELQHENGDIKRVAADFVFLATGFEPDYTLYHQLGVKLAGKQRVPHINPATLETNCPGVYVAGTAIAGNQNHYTVFITTCHDHASRIAKAITGHEYLQVGNLKGRDFPLSQYELE